MHAAVTEESVERANNLFWEQMLAMSLDPLGTSSAGSYCIGAEHVVGSCDLSGEWNGRIEVRLSRGLALQATATMLMQEIESVQAGDTIDAVKEIANMIAGTVKSALPRPCVMTVPSAEHEANDFCSDPGAVDSLTVCFQHPTGELMIRVCEWIVEPESALTCT